MKPIADTIAALEPPSCHGDRLTLALLHSYARQLADLDRQLATAPAAAVDILEAERAALLSEADAVGRVALAYHEERG